MRKQYNEAYAARQKREGGFVSRGSTALTTVTAAGPTTVYIIGLGAIHPGFPTPSQAEYKIIHNNSTNNYIRYRYQKEGIIK